MRECGSAGVVMGLLEFSYIRECPCGKREFLGTIVVRGLGAIGHPIHRDLWVFACCIGPSLPMILIRGEREGGVRLGAVQGALTRPGGRQSPARSLRTRGSLLGTGIW